MSTAPTEEPIEVVQARVRRTLVGMGLVILALPTLYLIGLSLARGRALEVANCLPPGIALSSPLADRPERTVGEALSECEARVNNGVLVDREGRPIAFERSGQPPGSHNDPRVRVIRVARPGSES
ncbi:MAG: hypothetical protein KatS3mg108_1352 [Isosphaeraceae bacterium]|jgi:hypothetical protein|nr:MAG: hypothetical protein KatS3mg108_1352 [Isosphaeraceae bacterium]